MDSFFIEVFLLSFFGFLDLFILQLFSSSFSLLLLLLLVHLNSTDLDGLSDFWLNEMFDTGGLSVLDFVSQMSVSSFGSLLLSAQLVELCGFRQGNVLHDSFLDTFEIVIINMFWIIKSVSSGVSDGSHLLIVNLGFIYLVDHDF